MDWLIESNKAANAAYTMRTLYNFGKKNHWINEELKFLLQRDCSHQTPAYKSAVKDILKRLK
jgi:Mn-containing catalase